MKIFLNNRVIEFVETGPGSELPSTLVTGFESQEQLQNAWHDFERYEKYRKMIIYSGNGGSKVQVEPVPGGPAPGASRAPAFRAFLSMFRYVPAAGGLVRNEKGEYLFIHRLGFWDLPKGKIDRKDLHDPGVSIHDQSAARAAAIREVTEETGLKSVAITGTLPSTWHIYSAKERYALKQTAWFRMEADSTQPLKPQASEGIFLAKWTSPAAIHCILTHTYASLREFLLEEVL